MEAIVHGRAVRSAGKRAGALKSVGPRGTRPAVVHPPRFPTRLRGSGVRRLPSRTLPKRLPAPRVRLVGGEEPIAFQRPLVCIRRLRPSSAFRRIPSVPGPIGDGAMGRNPNFKLGLDQRPARDRLIAAAKWGGDDAPIISLLGGGTGKISSLFFRPFRSSSALAFLLTPMKDNDFRRQYKCIMG